MSTQQMLFTGWVVVRWIFCYDTRNTVTDSDSYISFAVVTCPYCCQKDALIADISFSHVPLPFFSHCPLLLPVTLSRSDRAFGGCLDFCFKGKSHFLDLTLEQLCAAEQILKRRRSDAEVGLLAFDVKSTGACWQSAPAAVEFFPIRKS